ncbi:MAG: ABC transporter permease [Kiritimatiellae bacterium]|nr:ABC transporter permease [Kiritimatiellia bacterium]
MSRFFANLWKYRRYAIRSARAELLGEVAGSYLNWLWWVIEPLCFLFVYWFVFGTLFKAGEPHFASFIFVGLSLWEYFNRTVSGSVTLIASNRDLVTKVYLPKYVLLFSRSLVNLFKLGISLLLTFGLMACQHVPLSPYAPLLAAAVAILYLVSFGIGLILMHFGVLFSDMANLVRIGMRMLFFLSGVFYNIHTRMASLPRVRFWLLRVNPAAFCIDEARKALFFDPVATHFPSWQGLVWWTVLGMALCAAGVWLIHRNENTYAKTI